MIEDDVVLKPLRIDAHLGRELSRTSPAAHLAGRPRISGSRRPTNAKRSYRSPAPGLTWQGPWPALWEILTHLVGNAPAPSAGTAGQQGSVANPPRVVDTTHPATPTEPARTCGGGHGRGPPDDSGGPSSCVRGRGWCRPLLSPPRSQCWGAWVQVSWTVGEVTDSRRAVGHRWRGRAQRFRPCPSLACGRCRSAEDCRRCRWWLCGRRRG